MVLEEATVEDHVAIDQHQVVARGSGDCTVARSCQPKTAIFLPHMKNRKGGVLSPPIDHAPGRRAGTVVGYDDLCWRHGLTCDAAQSKIERLGPVVGCNDQ